MFDTPEKYQKRKQVLPLALGAWLLCLILGFWVIARTIEIVLAIYRSSREKKIVEL